MSDRCRDDQQTTQRGDSHVYASFVLRCWPGEQGRLRGRLIEVATGVSHYLDDVADLAPLVQQVIGDRLTGRVGRDGSDEARSVSEEEEEGGACP